MSSSNSNSESESSTIQDGIKSDTERSNSEDDDLINENLGQRICWVCLGSEEDYANQVWIKPCLCSGSLKWVHELCLKRWIDEKQEGNSVTPVTCSQCNSSYVILLPDVGYLMRILDVCDYLTRKMAPTTIGLMALGSVYWLAVSYGTYTLFLIFGKQKTLRLLNDSDPLLVLVGIPIIPVMLVIAKLFNWQDYLLRFWHLHFSRLLSRISSEQVPQLHDQENSLEQLTQPAERFSTDRLDFPRILCDAFFFPTVAASLGKSFFGNYALPVYQQTLLGGAAYIAVKGVLSTWYKHYQYIRRKDRRILDFDDSKRK